MESLDTLHFLGAFFAAFFAGAINSVAGGGTLISFPALLALGLPPVVANATNTIGIWPGTVGSMWGFRVELTKVNRRVFLILIPAMVGGVLGAVLLKQTPSDTFVKMVPWLILFATLLFAGQAFIQRKLKISIMGKMGTRALMIAGCAEFAVGIYGGYFGAGISILALAVLALLGMTDIMEMSAMTSLLSFVINGVAGILFIYAGLVAWQVAFAMIFGSLIGGYGAVGVARKIGKVAMKRFVVCVGVVITITLFVGVF